MAVLAWCILFKLCRWSGHWGWVSKRGRHPCRASGWGSQEPRVLGPPLKPLKEDETQWEPQSRSNLSHSGPWEH